MTQPLPRSLRERIGHALAFEVIAMLICAPALAWLMDKPLLHLGLLTATFSAVAMLWNMLFNDWFDRVQRRLGFERGFWVRVCHALLFEGGLVVMLVPLAAWWLSIDLLEALLLDIGLILFFLPYTLAFNWIYDVLRARWLARREAQAAAASCRGA
ncbi:Transmembrane pair domain-containing protein [Pseudomonas sp. 8Z]|uniref:multidrug/biocide efflux PACE transporter n=1 Tax=Pseudomonas sp. 8Z TaxID=2653166 RepID=UPI0012F28AEE|nr:multidrug/biocide efflux PACE transporter [Pseudomonas sp. 8Z]VXC77127.1 Transmembrane pair domain-containing protein [Pseudomonas sp. 8Z]